MNLLDIIFPKKCLECNKSGGYICQECITKMQCVVQSNNLNYSIFKYNGVIRKAIIALKYKFAYDICDELVNVCCSRLSTFYMLPDTILVPIPLHKLRQNWRGFNQAEILGKKLAEKMKWKFIPDLLIRTKNTKPQVGLKGSVRRSNLSNVFAINPCFLRSHSTCHLLHSTILLFDDVYTTGSTIKEARKTLSDYTRNKVYSLTIAR